MKNYQSIIRQVIDDPEKDPIEIFNDADGQASPEEARACIRMIPVLRKADKDLLCVIDEKLSNVGGEKL